MVLDAIGHGLGQLHSVAVDESAGLRPAEMGGACDVRKHLTDEYGEVLVACARVEGHPFFAFYFEQRRLLREAWHAPNLPRGVLHGDPFPDNVLVSPSTGALAGFVDFEDGCVGPLLFDVACACAAACFGADGSLDRPKLAALLGGYHRARPLTLEERERFGSFMSLALLCNAAWRFKQFNVDHPEMGESCRESYRELHDRILSLSRGGVSSGIVSSVVSGLPDSPSVFSI